MRAAEMRAATCWLGCSVASNGDARPASDQDARGGAARGQGATRTAPHGFPVRPRYRVTLRHLIQTLGRRTKTDKPSAQSALRADPQSATSAIMDTPQSVIPEIMTEKFPMILRLLPRRWKCVNGNSQTCKQEFTNAPNPQ